MDSKTRVKILELSFDIMQNLITESNYANKQELMAIAKKGVEISSKNQNAPIQLKMAYDEAYNKLNDLSWEEILEIKEIVSES